jgi:hypothetical protein
MSLHIPDPPKKAISRLLQLMTFRRLHSRGCFGVRELRG